MAKNPPANVADKRDTGLVARWRRSLGVGNGNLLQYSCLENSLDRRVWWTIILWVIRTKDSTAHRTLMWDFDMGGDCVCDGQGVLGEIFLPSAQFCCDLKPALKIT